jgi:hypothetical protein
MGFFTYYVTLKGEEKYEAIFRDPLTRVRNKSLTPLPLNAFVFCEYSLSE